MKRNILNKPIILYQMGKVGSSSLEHSLKNISIPTLHIHRYFFDSFETKGDIFNILYYQLKKIKQKVLYNYYLTSCNAKVISLYRDPLSRNISSFFQNIELYFKSDELKNLNFKELRNKFNSLENIHRTSDSWFIEEFYRKTNINIFDYPFDKEKGYITITKNNINYFICVLEKLDLLEGDIANFIDNTNFKILNKNVGNSKWYSQIYEDFKSKYTPSQSMLDRLYKSKTTKYFYTEAQIFHFQNKWK